MNIYFVRHGESESNAKRIAQGPSSLLNDIGRRQAAMVAGRFLHMPLDLVVASPYERAKETAEIIHKTIPQVPFVFSDLFTEIRRPRSVWGKPHDDELVRKTAELWKEHAHLPDWYFEDEENFHDVKIRAKKALEYLASQNHHNILVVTHGLFLKFLISVMLFEEGLTIRECKAIRQVFFSSNTGVTVCQYESENRQWQVITWNDLAHLAE